MALWKDMGYCRTDIKIKIPMNVKEILTFVLTSL